MGVDIKGMWNGLGDRGQASLMDGAFRLGGGILSGMGQGKRDDALLAANKEKDQVDSLLRMLELNQDQDQFEQSSKRLAMGQAGMQLGGPLDQQADRQKMALQRAFLFDGKDGGPQYSLPGPESTVGGFVGNLPRFDSAKPFFSDSAMMSAEMPFWETISQQTGGKVNPNFGGAGYQGASNAQSAMDKYSAGVQADASAASARSQGRLDQTQSAIQQALGSSTPGAQGSQKPAQKKPGFWGKAGRLGLKIAPIAASFIPGVGPLAAMGISAATGAASGALDGGGLAGALKGGAIGAGTSALAGGLGRAGGPALNNGMSAASRPIGQMAAPAANLVYGAGQAANPNIMNGLARGVGKVRF